ncbi:DUF2290 domain-containing protein [Rhodococcus sp. YH3-3]|uniref:DUF2290 domain-containing protein n=1 Tax=Rhodococcus sp. YH3-3 TaxID=1803579 RepID=UPI000A72BEF8|nr:DUF2290 domain-containing protein [Rhodococcus sp. YH3-3]
MSSRNSTSARDILKEVNSLVGFLVENGFADRYNPATILTSNGKDSVQHSKSGLISASFKSQSYRDLYTEQLESESFNVLMLDGALIQMAYEFESRKLTKHRLAFLPSPDLLEYQNNADIYSQEILFAEVVERTTVPVPIRFDFDNRPEVVKEVDHPACHLTIGQYKNCRIAATAALAPTAYINFILRNFYNTATRKISEKLPISDGKFAKSIHLSEQQMVHIGIPMIG